MISHEGDPTNEIVDLETFSEWLTAYKKQVLADPSVSELKMPIGAEEIIGYRSVDILDYPWGEVPQSIQDIMAIKYEAARDSNHEKSIDITMHDERLNFTLNSPLVVKGLDTVGENYVGLGVSLNFGEEGFESINNGTWDVGTTSPHTRARIKTLFLGKEKPSIEDISKITASMRPKSLSVTLPQLHDVSRLLVKAKPYAVVVRFVAAGLEK